MKHTCLSDHTRQSIAARFHILFWSLLALWVIPENTFADIQFQALGDVGAPGGGSFTHEATGVSADGSVVVGMSGTEAFRWTESSGIVGLGFYRAYGVSADGKVIVGKNPGASTESVVWTETGGKQVIPGFPGYDEAHGVSDDGLVVVGTAGTTGYHWSSSSGITNLGHVSGNGPTGGNAASADGSVVVGDSAGKAFRWTQDSGIVSLGDLPGGGSFSRAKDVSTDGSIVVGEGKSASGDEAFVWTAEDGIQGLGDLSGGRFFSEAIGVSTDGSMIVGIGESDAGVEAVLWFLADDGYEPISLNTLLDASGIDRQGFTLTTANAISNDGTTIVGSATNESGYAQPYRLYSPDGIDALLDPIPEPSAGILAGMAMLMLIRGRQGRGN